jgi:hypothetical protein
MSSSRGSLFLAWVATCVIYGVIIIVGLLVSAIAVLWLVWAVIGMWQAIGALL